MIFPFPQQALLVPKFGIAVQLITDLDDVPEHVIIHVYVPSESEEIIRMEMTSPGVQHQENATKAHMRALIPCQPFAVSGEGYIEVMIDTGRETMRAGRLMVKFAPPPPAVNEESEPEVDT